ncbi:hypothetical protein Nwi_1560 [Nitrobacter winogradskyi Nb-255]|uniref:Uncharacterized protein n=1 Tax=Nitrobacter winogradskyi (strain ATCC 25391 / DSM 10237 / CIP 104748 / NCIMB 11846 / Nb-255) TaxID=323098 RepID=Q3SSC0_NITWN|nr:MULTISPECIES: hypothetical protein [Nitrobacter]ABA04821.1 hypothetical protein Nwi_1560 [Nitrobacter winogradskyi Nb-255]MCB1394285.1 hypothetical protein [Nitrobacter sp.]
MKNEVLQGLIDPDRVPDLFAEGFASIEKAGNACVRFTLYARRNYGTEIEHIVIGRVVIPKEILPTAYRQTRAVLEGGPFLSAVPIASFLT